MAVVKLDENVPDSVGRILRQAGHDVALARDQHLAGSPDDRLLEVASGEGRVLVTFDRDFTNVLRHSPVGTPGIVVLRLSDQALPTVRRAALALVGMMEREPIQGRLWVLDEFRLRVWPQDG